MAPMERIPISCKRLHPIKNPKQTYDIYWSLLCRNQIQNLTAMKAEAGTTEELGG